MVAYEERCDAVASLARRVCVHVSLSACARVRATPTHMGMQSARQSTISTAGTCATGEGSGVGRVLGGSGAYSVGIGGHRARSHGTVHYCTLATNITVAH